MLPGSKDRTWWGRGRIKGNSGVSGSRKCWQSRYPEDNKCRGSHWEGNSAATMWGMESVARSGKACRVVGPQHGVLEGLVRRTGRTGGSNEHLQSIETVYVANLHMSISPHAAPTRGHFQNPHTS